jgi:L-alanine-DL-glutamate epimerase-like enolase superfamily enzyme
MKIGSARAHLVETEPGIRLTTSYGPPPDRRGHVFVEITGDDGTVGWGEATPLPFFTGETPETVQLVLERHLLPPLVGEDPWDLPRLHRRLGQRVAGNAAARAAIDVACHDLQARAAGLPLYKLLGTHGAETLPRTYVLSLGGRADAVAEAKAWVGRGYRTLKMKVGGGVAADVERVAAVRDAVGAVVRIRVDANAGYTLREARELLRALAPLGIELAEQPIAAHDLDGWRQLRRATDLPLMADESLYTPADALALVGGRLVDFLVIKLIKTGGIHDARRIAAIAQTAGVECILSTPFDTPIGAAAAIHTAFAVGSLEHAHDLPPSGIEAAAPPGRIGRPRGPGLGIAGVQTEEVSWRREAEAGAEEFRSGASLR